MLAERTRPPEISDNAWLRECLDGFLSYSTLWGEAQTMRFSLELHDFIGHVHDNIREAASRAGDMDLRKIIIEVTSGMITSVRIRF